MDEGYGPDAMPADAGRLHGEVESIDTPPSGFKGSGVLTAFAKVTRLGTCGCAKHIRCRFAKKLLFVGKALRRCASSLNFAENTVAVQLRLIDASMRRPFSAYASADEETKHGWRKTTIDNCAKPLSANG